MVLNESDKIDVRRHLNISFAGVPGYGDVLGLRVATRAGNMEMYMNGLQPQEESVLLGVPLGLTYTYGPFTLGQQLGFTFTSGGTPLTYTVTAADLAAVDPLTAISLNVSQMVNTSGIGFFAAGRKSGAFRLDLAVLAASRTAFSLSATGGPQVVAAGTTFPYPQLVIDDPTNPRTISGVLPMCNYLESQWLGSDARIAFWQAGSSSTGQVIFNKAETRIRRALYGQVVRQMSVLVGFRLGTNYPRRAGV